MTYLRFHLLFNLPALVLLGWLARDKLTAAHAKCIAAICGIVLLVTTPWDAWAVHERIWDFDWHRVTTVAASFAGTRWRLPAEEIAFFLIETVLVSLLTVILLSGKGVATATTTERENRR
jgi:lycopene cyclase domain-containing protein